MKDDVSVFPNFRVIWNAPGWGEVDHLVPAQHADAAGRISARELREALGEEFDTWQLEAVI